MNDLSHLSTLIHNAIARNLGRPFYKAAEEAASEITAAGYARRRLIATVDELEALPPGVVVATSGGTIAARFDDQHGVVFGDDRPFPWHVLEVEFPATVLWEAP